MAGTNHKEKMILRNELLDEYICTAWSRAYMNERMLAQRLVGKLKNLKGRLDRFSLDKKLMLLTALNKRYLLIMYDNDTEKVSYQKMEKIFNHYVTAQKNFESDEARRELGVFIINERQAAKQFFIGAYRFAEPLYKMAENGDAYQFVSQFKTPAVSISKTEQNERNLDVYAMLFSFIEKGYFLDDYLKAYKIEYGHFTMIARLFRTEKPMSEDEVSNKHNLIWNNRNAPSKKKLNELIADGYVESHTYNKSDDDLESEDEEKKLTVFTLTSKGIALYTEIVEKLMTNLYE